MRSGRKGELADDVDAKPWAAAAAIFCVERSLDPLRRDRRMALRIGADADFLDAGLAQPAFLDDRQRVREWPQRSTSPPITSKRRTSASPARCASNPQSVCASGSVRAAICTTGSRPARRSRPTAAVNEFVDRELSARRVM